MRTIIALVFLLACIGCSASRPDGTSEGARMEGISPAAAKSSAGMETDSFAPASEAPNAPSGEALVPDRKIIRTGQLRLRVDNVGAAEKRVTKMATAAKGFVEATGSTDLDSTHPEITMTLRIPVSKFDGFFDQIESVGVRLSKSVSSQDVTGQLIDLEARLKTMRAEEVTLREILSRATKLGDVIALQQRLSELRGQIESLDGQRKAIAGQADYSTLELTLEQGLVAGKGKDPNWLEQAWLEAVNSLGAFFRHALVFLLWVVVFSPIWGGAFLAFRWLWKRAK
ncbi:MAG: DUF4349 domain-containing protein [Fimbriimonas sp.]